MLQSHEFPALALQRFSKTTLVSKKLEVNLLLLSLRIMSANDGYHDENALFLYFCCLLR
jgi:hypothetical protein